jgi:hypothetical protein
VVVTLFYIGLKNISIQRLFAPHIQGLPAHILSIPVAEVSPYKKSSVW